MLPELVDENEVIRDLRSCPIQLLPQGYFTRQLTLGNSVDDDQAIFKPREKSRLPMRVRMHRRTVRRCIQSESGSDSHLHQILRWYVAGSRALGLTLPASVKRS